MEKPINQWDLEADAGNRRKARVNECEHVAIGFDLTSDWLNVKMAKVFSQWNRVIMQVPRIAIKLPTKSANIAE